MSRKISTYQEATRKRLKILVMFIFVFVMFFGLPIVSHAQKDGQNEDKLCQDFYNTLTQGVKEQDAVSSYIMVGHSPCFVIKCAVKGKGNLSEIIEGALNAGVTSDVISRCTVLGGAEPDTVARMMKDLIPPEGPSPGPYNETPLEKPHVPVSPSGF